MKHIITILTALFVALLTNTHADSGSSLPAPVNVVDAERAAGEFVSRAAAYYTGTSYYEQTQKNGSYTWISTQFVMKGGKITKMTVYSAASPNGVEIDIPIGGLSGFPRNTVGETRNFNVNLEGYDDAAQFVSYGPFNSVLFKASDNIVVELTPSWRLTKIHFPKSAIPSGVNPDTLMLQFGNSSAAWSSYLDGFWLYTDPLADGTWTLIDRSTGFTYPFDPNNSTAVSAYAGVAIKYVGGAVNINWINEFTYYSGQFLDSVVERQGQWVSAKTFFTKLGGDGMALFAYNLEGKMEVSIVGDDGSRTLVRSFDVSQDNDKNYFQLPAGYDGVVITFTGKVNYSGGFVFEAYRQSSKGVVIAGGQG